MSDTVEGEESAATHLAWFGRGVLATFCVPGMVLVLSFIGFAALAAETGFSLTETVFMVVVIWALPAQVVLIGAVVSGATLPACALAVALSSVRLMPMTVSMVPELRTPATRPLVLYLLSHFIAVTSWVIAMERFPGVPRQRRTGFYFGIGTTLIVLNVLAVAVVFLTSAQLPAGVAAAMFLLTPMYFLSSLWSSAREWAGHAAIVLGLALGPIFHFVVPGFDLLAAGLIGGLLAYAAHRIRRGSAPA
ncbi:MAG: AzlC family ABC transporter permease [Rhizobiaceae bacterium]